ncbi:hypothetical protein Fmac_024868 [Flemingia macrophylla]|uniref:Uncharacterized protein n=1 Tax=Flemingia macrophylla TaxID=520843 RepID=A0ABD1LQL9_9FABA
MSILRLMLQTSIAGHHSSRGLTLDREDGFQLLVVSKCRNDAIFIRGVHDVATYTSIETRKVEGKLDALVNLVTQLAVNQKPASVARVCGIHSSNDYHTNTLHRADDFQLIAISVEEMMPLSLEEFTTWLQDTSAKTRKVEGKLDALVNLVTQLAVNQKPASVARQATTQQQRPTLDREDGFPTPSSFGARNDAIVIRGVHDVATDTSAETRKVEGKLDALLNLVTQLAVNQKPASVARVCGIRSSNEHQTNTRWLPTLSSFVARNDATVIKGVHDVATDISAETRKVEGKLDAFLNLVTQLAVNQKPVSVVRVCGIRSSNDHQTNVYPSSQQHGVNKHPEAYAANKYIRPP